ncbi:inositol polyphosphate 1-phosphatase isoform X2 [Harmonia axyridis]|uniref:inositol polyphosphate 1-phosphatase isoform X2 n=1 Tax=Harmonia axyridis TaxID=115357 RepID=UPI001E278A73|nr:inositol polyphosphate 1-phosphatase isoform X2 [Harmonia axyridis]
MDLLETLIVLSEKAARIARLIRKDEHLFGLLVEQKDQDHANPRFFQDFKTLADVLIQQMIKHFLELKFPGIADRVRGEENNTFCNTLGDKITVDIKKTSEETADLLENVLNGDKKASLLLAEEVHRSIDMKDVNTKSFDDDTLELDVNQIGIWIDPIDSTAEYINASSDNSGERQSGLNCVTILIGVYSIESEESIMGVINQPFSNFEENCWTGECIWGVCFNSTSLSSLNIPATRTHVAYLSSSEDEDVKLQLRNMGYTIKEAAGAGNKILKVIKNQGDCYILSKSTTFKWDTCGPQAILRSLGGDIVTYTEAVCNRVISVKYPHDVGCEKDASNFGGLLAFRITDVLDDFVR